MQNSHPRCGRRSGGSPRGLEYRWSARSCILAIAAFALRQAAASAAINAGVYGRNYDYRPRYYDARLALIQASGSHASIGASEHLTGRLDGMNQHGLVVGLHLVRTRPKYPGLSCALIVRIILDQCATAAEAVALLRRLPARDGVQLLASGCDGSAAVVEAVPGSVAVRTGAWMACTNHFQSRLLRPLNRRPPTRKADCRRSSMGRRRVERRGHVHGVEPVDVASIPSWIPERRRNASHDRR